MQVTQRRRILLMSLAICSWGILLHSSYKAVPKAWSVLGRETLCRTRWPRMSQTCSIGHKSGDRAGQSRWSTLFCCRNCCTILARWGIVLSSCSTTWCCWTKGRTTGCSTSLMKPLYCHSSVKHKQLRTGMPHTIRLPPPYQSCSTMAQFPYLSPLRHQTRRRLSSISSRNHDSSVKSTVAHCWLVHRRFCLVHASLACVCLWESGTPM